MKKCPQVEILELKDKIAQLQAELVEKENAIYQYNVWSSADTVKIDKLQAERDSLMDDMQRIYDNCSDVDLIIDITGAAVEGNDE